MNMVLGQSEHSDSLWNSQLVPDMKEKFEGNWTAFFAKGTVSLVSINFSDVLRPEIGAYHSHEVY